MKRGLIMNKQEAIKNINGLWSFPFEDGPFEIDLINKKQAIDIISQIDEPQKPKVPQFVADWIEWCKKNKITLLGADTAICNNKNIRVLDASGWAWKNQETFVKAWIYGYEVEKEKLYLASFRDTNQYLGWNENLGEWFMSGTPFTSGVKQTQETWEGVGIWNNPAFEIKKVEE